MQDEMADYFNKITSPKILLTTCDRPSSVSISNYLTIINCMSSSYLQLYAYVPWWIFTHVLDIHVLLQCMETAWKKSLNCSNLLSDQARSCIKHLIRNTTILGRRFPYTVTVALCMYYYYRSKESEYIRES